MSKFEHVTLFIFGIVGAILVAAWLNLGVSAVIRSVML